MTRRFCVKSVFLFVSVLVFMASPVWFSEGFGVVYGGLRIDCVMVGVGVLVVIVRVMCGLVRVRGTW